MRFRLMAEATYSALSKQLKSRWHTALFVRLTIGAWRRISAHDAVNGVQLGWRAPGDFHVGASIDSSACQRAGTDPTGPADTSASRGFAATVEPWVSFGVGRFAFHDRIDYRRVVVENRPFSIRETMFAQIADKTIFEQAKSYAYAYMDDINHRRIFPDDETIERLTAFDEPLPQRPQLATEILKLLDECGSPATVAQTGGRYFGFVNGSAVPVALAARWLSDIWNQNPALYVISPTVAKLEQVCERWVRDLLNLPPETVAGFVSGTSIATMCGLAAGRYALLKKLGWDVNDDGLFGAPAIRVVVSEQAHSTVFKALALLGLGKKRVELVPADSEGRISAADLPKLNSRTLVILQAGNVNSGSFDDFEHVCSLAQDAGAWVHVDGAFGLWAAASPKKRHLTQGVEKADSWSVDGHKTLNSSYDCGIVLCKNREALVASMQATGAYIQYSGNRDSMLYTPDMSRRARAVELWATLRFLGRSGVADLVDGLCERAIQFAEELARNGFQVLNEVVFNQVLVAGATPAETKAILSRIQASGECWCGETNWRNKPAIRISVCSWATTSEDVTRAVQAFMKARDAV